MGDSDGKTHTWWYTNTYMLQQIFTSSYDAWTTT
jgi:hypothetical protein